MGWLALACTPEITLTPGTGTLYGSPSSMGSHAGTNASGSCCVQRRVLNVQCAWVASCPCTLVIIARTAEQTTHTFEAAMCSCPSHTAAYAARLLAASAKRDASTSDACTCVCVCVCRCCFISAAAVSVKYACMQAIGVAACIYEACTSRQSVAHVNEQVHVCSQCVQMTARIYLVLSCPSYTPRLSLALLALTCFKCAWKICSTGRSTADLPQSEEGLSSQAAVVRCDLSTQPLQRHA